MDVMSIVDLHSIPALLLIEILCFKHSEVIKFTPDLAWIDD